MTNESYTINFEDQEPDMSGYNIQFEDRPVGESAPPKWAEYLHKAARYGAFGLGGMLLARDPDPNTERRTGSGVLDAIQSGYQGSATGMILRGDLPTVTLDPHHAKWYERALSQAAGVLSDIPEMALGGTASALAGVETGPGAVALGAAGAFAVPTAIRSALTQAYSKGRVKSAGDFLARTGIVIRDTGESAVVGGATGAAGALVGKIASPFLADAVASGRIGAGTAEALGRALTASGEYGGLVVAPAALEGRLPEKQDFLDAAVLMVGLKGAHVISGKLMGIYSKTGVPPLQVAADAKTDPTIMEDLAGGTQADPQVGADPELPRAYQAAAAHQAAVDAFPMEKAQQVLDQPFADIPEAKLPYQLNMAYINGPDDLRALQARMADVYRSDIDTSRGGAQSWEATSAKAAQQVADLTGTELEKVMVGRNPGDTANAVELKIRGDMLMQATVEAAKAVKAVQEAGPDVTDAMKADALTAIHRLAMIQADFTGASSEVGRALNFMRSMKTIREQGEGIRNLVDLYGGEPEKLLQMASALDSPEGMARFARAANKASTWDQITEGWRAGLLGPITCVKKALSDITIMASRPLVDTVALGWNRLAGSSERMSAVEPLARIIGNVNGTSDGLVQAWEALKTEHLGGVVESRGAIPGLAGEIIRTPYRAIEAVTALFRTMEERGEAYARAARRAAFEGYDPMTREFSERVAELALNPSEETAAQLEAFGKRMTFSASLGDKGQAFTRAVRAFHAEPIFPFLKAPANVFKEQARLSPLAPLVGDWRSNFKAGGIAQSKAAAEMAVGLGIASLGLAWAASGKISGAGDPDPNKNRVQRASGWQPYSVKVGNTWYSIKMIHPVGTLLGMCADVHDLAADMDDEQHDKAVRLLGKAFAHAVTEQTFLEGMVALVKALNSPERGASTFAQEIAASVIPATMAQTAMLMDPYQREMNGILDAVKARIPGAREGLLPQRDPFGEPIQSAERFGGISPITERSAMADKVRMEAARLGVSVAQAPRAINLPAAGQSDLGKVALSPEQRDVFADTSGHMAHQVLSALVGSPSWDALPRAVQAQVFKTVFEHTRKAGELAALPPAQRAVEAQRVAAELAARFQE